MLPIDFKRVLKLLEWAELYSVYPVKAWEILEPYDKVKSNLRIDFKKWIENIKWLRLIFKTSKNLKALEKRLVNLDG